jgi:hypothetical protein
MSWSGTTGYTYQTQKYYTSWADFGGSQSGSGAKTSDSFTVGYGASVYGRVKVTDPDGVVDYTNQRYVTAGRAAGSDTDTYSWNDWVYTNGTATGSVIASNRSYDTEEQFNGESSTNVYPISYPHVFDDNTDGTLGSTNGNIVYVYAVRIRMTRANSEVFDLTANTQTNTTGRKVFFYGPGSLGMRLWKQTDGTPVGQSWGTPDQTVNSFWTGTAQKEHTWNVDNTVTGNVLVNGVRCLRAPGNEWFISGSNAAGTVYSTNWGTVVSGAATTVALTVYYFRATRTFTTYANDYGATNSTYG